MGLQYHPRQGTIVVVDFNKGFSPPEMTKRRLAVVLTPKIDARPGLLTVVALGQTAPNPAMPYHAEIHIPFQMPPQWGAGKRWVKGDMINAVGFDRTNLVRLGKDRQGNRMYQTAVLPKPMFEIVQKCVLHGLGLSELTNNM